MNKNVILNYGIERDGNFLAVPFHVIDGIITNYSFVTDTNGECVYKTEVGELKEQGLRCLGIDIEVVKINNDTKANMEREIAAHHERVRKSKRQRFGKAVFYKIVSKNNDEDSAFYDALQINGRTSTSMCFARLGIAQKEPFTYVSIEEMFYQNKPEIVCSF